MTDTNASIEINPDVIAWRADVIAAQTASALDYTSDELDDLTDRKVEAVPFSGDTLARVVRARRGAARATGQPDPYGARDAVDTVRRVWGSYRAIWIGENTTRRMVAVGHGYPESMGTPRLTSDMVTSSN